MSLKSGCNYIIEKYGLQQARPNVFIRLVYRMRTKSPTKLRGSRYNRRI